jgi:preprotein translocase subunit SecY
MASAVEQLAKNANWGTLARATELKQRILFVLGALIVYRLGTYVPIPGIDVAVWKDIFSQKGGGILDMFNMFSGGALQRYVHLRIEHHAVHFGIDYHAASRNGGLPASCRPGRKRASRVVTKINAADTRYLTVLLAAVQAYGVAVASGKPASRCERFRRD